MFSEFIYKKQVQLFLAILNRIECGSLHLTLPDGCTHIFKAENAGPDADLRLHTRSALSRILRDGKMGFCEAIMDGDASSKALPNLIELAVYHDEDMDLQLKPNFIRKWALRAYHHWRRNSKSGSAKNISHHYDLGNDFYAHWLDPTMTYSSAVFENEGDDLTKAQMNKYQKLVEMADIQPDDHVLEIGCGWAVLPNM